MNLYHSARVLVAGGLLLAFAGCRPGGKADSLTEPNYRKIQEGMDYRAVVALLGEPSEKRGELPQEPSRWKWRSGSEEIAVMFSIDGPGRLL